ncbi:MAG: hypothetical protein RL033_3360, partial [Pseudomonadota bacterium]
MTSKGMLLLTLAGVVGVGCSAPADGDGPAPPPTGNPPYFGMPQTQVQMQAPAPSNMPPVGAATGSAGASSVATGAAGSGGVATGAAGAGGSGGAATPTGTIPVGAPGTGFALTPVAGWVAGTTNEAGIQGSFYTISDSTSTPPGVTTITMDDFATSGDSICVSGVASQVVGTAFGQYWGGGVAFDLGDPGQTQAQQPWARGRVTGFRYTLTGPTIPPATSLRFTVTFEDGAGANTGDPYCQQVTATSGTAVTSTLASPQLIQSCWQAGGAQLPATAL